MSLNRKIGKLYIYKKQPNQRSHNADEGEIVHYDTSAGK